MPRRDQSDRQLAQAIYDTHFARRLMPTRLANLRLAGDPLQGTDYDRAGGKGGISDPTPTQAAHLERYHIHEQQILDASKKVADAAAHLLRLVQAAPSDVDTARIAEQNRCSGGTQDMDGGGDLPPVGWANPDCRGIYEKGTGHNQGLCSACIRRRNRWEADQQAMAS